MQHLGDITAISGYDVPPVDVIIGGSPCQDLSAEGKRAGLAGARSGLFMEQIRLIKEMQIQTYREDGQACLFGHDSWSGKTSLERSALYRQNGNPGRIRR